MVIPLAVSCRPGYPVLFYWENHSFCFECGIWWHAYEVRIVYPILPVKTPDTALICLTHLTSRYPLNQLRRDNMGSKSALTEDDSLFQELAASYANANPSMEAGSSCTEKGPAGLLHGADWNEHIGAMMDYLYFKHQTLMVGSHASSVLCVTRHMHWRLVGVESLCWHIIHGSMYVTSRLLPIFLVASILQRQSCLSCGWRICSPSLLWSRKLIKVYWKSDGRWGEGALIECLFLLPGVAGQVLSSTGSPMTDAVAEIQGLEHPLRLSKDGRFFRIMPVGEFAILASDVGKSFEVKILQL